MSLDECVVGDWEAEEIHLTAQMADTTVETMLVKSAAAAFRRVPSIRRSVGRSGDVGIRALEAMQSNVKLDAEGGQTIRVLRVRALASALSYGSGVDVDDSQLASCVATVAESRQLKSLGSADAGSVAICGDRVSVRQLRAGLGHLSCGVFGVHAQDKRLRWDNNSACWGVVTVERRALSADSATGVHGRRAGEMLFVTSEWYERAIQPGGALSILNSLLEAVRDEKAWVAADVTDLTVALAELRRQYQAILRSGDFASIRE